MTKITKTKVGFFSSLPKWRLRGGQLPTPLTGKKKGRFKLNINLNFLLIGRMSIKEQAYFAKSLSFLVKAGVPILNSLHIMREQTCSRSQTRVLDKVISDVANGQYLHQSLGRFRHTFGDFAINMIRIGETGGILNQNLEYLADELKKKQDLRRRVLGALVYPIFISLATLTLTAVLTAFIFPKILPIFQSLNVELPFTTRFLIWVSSFLRDWGLLLVAIIAVIITTVAVLRAYIQSFHRFLNHVMLALPLFGRLSQSYNLTNFCRTMGLLLKSGIRVAEAIQITAETTPNQLYRDHYHQLAKSILRGEKMSKHLEKNKGLFPVTMTQMIIIGETTGSLADTLLYLAELYESQVEDITKNMSGAIEPVLMIFMGIMVGFVAVSVITPIYGITKNLHPR